jgi:hypothetical protein
VRLVIAAVSLLLALPAVARADLRDVKWPLLTNDPVVTFTSDDPVECSQDDVTYTACTSPWHPLVGADGKYAIFVRSAGASTAGHFTLDRTPPAIAFTAGPADGAAQQERTVAIAFTVTDAHPGTVECTWDGGATPCNTPIGGVALGEHTFVIHAVDAAGNETTVTRAVTVVQPQVTHIDPKPNDEGGVLSTTASSPSVRLSSTHTRRWTRLHALTIRDVEAGTAVKATCTGKGCPKRALRVTAKNATVSLAGLTGRKLTPGTVIKITLSAKGKVPRTFTIKIRATRAPQIR